MIPALEWDANDDKWCMCGLMRTEDQTGGTGSSGRKSLLRLALDAKSSIVGDGTSLFALEKQVQ